VVNWIRLFSYLYLVPQISKLLITMLQMLQETLLYMFVIFGIICAFAVVFNLRFGETAPELYGNFALSLRNLFDIMTRAYVYVDLGDQNIEHSYFLIVYGTISTIFILNYIIATITTIYKAMMIEGEFHKKAYKYQWIMRFKRIELREDLAELLLLPPPLNLLLLPSYPFLFCPSLSGPVLKAIRLICFWTENALILLYYSIAFAFKIPFAYFNIIPNILLVFRVHIQDSFFLDPKTPFQKVKFVTIAAL